MTGRAPAAPREWVGDWPFPWPAVRTLPDGADFRACFCVVDFQLARTRADQPYLKLNLTDRYGPVEARVWTGAEASADALRPGDYIGAQGRIEYFNGQLQLCIETLEPVRASLEDLPLFLPRSTRPPEEMDAELDALVTSVDDVALRQLLEVCLAADSDLGAGFRMAPAAKYNHHAFLGGLLEHTLSVAAVCAALARHYGPELDRDLLVSAALLHDIGKVREIGARAGFPYTDEGKLLGHILLGLELVTEAARAVPVLAPARLLLLQHLIASHQGRYEWQSPREPATMEAIVLHYADDLDAKLQQVRELMRQGGGPWTAYDRSFRREFLRSAVLRAPGEADPVETVTPSEPTTAPQPPAPEPGPPPLPAGGGSGHRPARARGATGFHRLSEDTLDLFGENGGR